MIVSKTGDKHGYLKFVEREEETKVLQYLIDRVVMEPHDLRCSILVC